MADARRFSTTPQLDIEKILLEAQSRWLRPAEIVEILRNYQNFRIAPEPPNRPPSGSLFLFDRKVLRYFRKDGHNWRKKKDGKTVKEAHEKLKDGSIDVLHCYYAHGEENEKFQRRTYWMLEEEFTHIVLVHYREVQTGRAAYGQSADSEENFRNIKIESPASSNSMSNHHLVPSRATGTESPNSSQTNEYEDIDSDNHQASSRYHPHPEPQLQFRYGPVNNAPPYIQEFAPDTQGYYPRMESEYDPFSHGRMTNDPEGTGNPTGGWSMNGSPHQDDLLPSWGRVLEHCTEGSSQVPLSAQIIEKISSSDDPNVLNAGSYNQEFLQVNAEGGAAINRPADYGFLLKQLSLDNSRREGESGLKKYDSFTRWMSKELEEVDESDIKMGPSVNWETVVSEGVIEDSGISRNEDAYLLGPSLAQDQLFSILDFSPNWCYAGIETPVRITGTFLTDQSEASYIKWSCMFGEVEVPVEVSNNGILLCRTPPHKPGRVPFYITCSNRLACSEIREFEYCLPGPEQALFLLHLRFESILSLNHGIPGTGPILSGEKLQLSYKIETLLKEDDEWSNMLRRTGDPDPFPVRVLDPSRERALKEKLATWLIYKIAEEGKGPAVLDREGQGVIHLAAALGYDWALQPTIVAGVSIDFRDVHGWTALHWAAFCGREKTVGVLFSLGAAPGVVTDPSPEFPSGRTPADLASANGHKGIAGFLAESSLTKHLNTLTLKDQGSSEVAQMQAEDVARKSMLRMDDGNMEAGLSAFRNAAQTAARIHQVFRIHSFQRKKISENDYGPSKGGMSDERALSIVTVKSKKSGDAAATQIQKKFRGWKGRKEFLTIRQHVVKIQAHVRGHQVRKHYRKIVWTVGIVEKVILRWRRKGPGLRNIFKSEGSTSSPQANTLSAPASAPAPEDDYDFLKEGRKQTEARLAKALDRVKSMVQYPEARDQYRRLLTVVEDYQESRAVLERVLNDPEVMENEPMFDIDELLGDDTYMPM